MRLCKPNKDRCSKKDGKTTDWLRTRRAWVRALRSETRVVVMLLALLECLKHGPLEMVFAGKKDFPAKTAEDYGISYTVGYVLSYLYVCAFTVVWQTLFQWWVPKEGPDPNGPVAKAADWLHKLDLFFVPVCIVLCSLIYVLTLLDGLVYVDGTRTKFFQLPSNDRHSWKSRGLVFLGIAIMLSTGYGAFQVWELYELANVKPYEYAMIVVPVQINLGICLGTKIQKRIYKRQAMKMAARVQHVEEVGSQAAVDEKTALIAAE